MSGEKMNNSEEEGKHLENISPGVAVEIFLKTDRYGKNPVQGIVKDVLTHSSFHSHGILVQLEDGKIGRVQKILTNLKEESPQRFEQPSRKTAPKPIVEIDFSKIVSGGENEFVEFKSSALWSKKLTDEEMRSPTASRDIRNFGRDASKIIIAKTLAGFLNTRGGHLVIGIKENKTKDPDEIIGIEGEFGALEDQCTDGYRRMIVDSIIRKYFHPDIFNHFSDYIKITFHEINEKQVCWIQIVKSDVSAFLTIRNVDYFFIRLDAETRQLVGKEMVEYCAKRFVK